MIDLEEIQKSYAKSFMDKSRVWFIEHYFSTFNADVRQSTPFLLFPRQKLFLKTVSENSNTIAIKHRQCGITTISSAWIAAQFVFASKDSPERVLAIANKLDLSVQIVDKIRDFLNQVPRWFWGDEFYSPDPKSDKNKKSIFIRDSKQELQLFNGCQVFARSSGENAARGISAASILIFDEAAFIENGKAVYGSAIATTASVKDAKIIMVSTPNGKDELYYNTYRQAVLGANNFKVVDFKWYQDLRYNRNLKWYKKNEKTGETIWEVEKTLDEFGKINYDEERWKKLVSDGWTPTSPWYEGMCQSYSNDKIMIAQELDVSFLGSSDNVVDPSVIEMQEKLNVREPLDDFKDPIQTDTWFWRKPIKGHHYIMAIDPSRGDAADSTALEVIDIDGTDENGLPILEQVMEYHGKRTGDEIGVMAFNYAKIYGNPLIVIDAIGGVGDPAILTLMNLGYKNLFYDDPQLNKYTVQNIYSSLTPASDGKLPGFHNNSVRYQLLNNFALMVKNNEFKIRSVRAIRELETWVYKNGRQDHMSGSHDDILYCLAMALFVLKFSIGKLEAAKSLDEAILKSYIMNNSSSRNKENEIYSNEKSIKPSNGLPYWGRKKKAKKIEKEINGSYLWMFGGLK
jgi:hypothetical protein